MKVDGIEFNSQTEYLAALRDRNRIEAIKGRVDITNPQTAGTLYQRLKSQPFYFETEVGKKFLRELSKTAGASASGKRIIQNRVDHSEELEEEERLKRDTASKRETSSKASKTVKPSKQSRTTAQPGRKTAVTVLEGDDDLKSRYSADEIRSRYLDELAKGPHERNEFWDDEDDIREIASDDQPKGKNNTLQKLALMGIGAAAAIILVVFAGKEINSRIEDYKSNKKLKDLQSMVLQGTNASNTRLDGVLNAWASDGKKPADESENSGENGEASTVDPTPSPIPTILPEFQKVYAKNDDMVGWIQIPGTVVNYPVMQTKDDMEYYLLRDFDKQSDKNGLPFVDSRADVFERTANVLIYGHCMNSGSMFATLLKYKDRSYYEAHPIIYFDTIYERAEYEIVAAFQSKIAFAGEKAFRYYNFIDTDSAEEFDEFIKNAKAISYYDTGITASFGDDLITLSTCDKEIQNGRMVIVARRIRK